MEDYLAFGLLFRRMLQDSSSSEGPRVPRSIHSTQDYYKTQDPTLMEIDVSHGSQEFSDLKSQISGFGSRVSGLGIDCSVRGGFGL